MKTNTLNLEMIYLRDNELDILNQMSSIPLLNEEEERQLLIKMTNGDKEAKEVLILSNLRLVASISKKYVTGKVSFLDLFQEGVIGLIEALDHFNLEFDNKLSSYATHYIKKSVLGYFKDHSNTIRLPRYIYDKLKEYKLIEQTYLLQKKRKPTLTEMCKLLNVTIETVEILSKCSCNTSLSCSITDEMEEAIIVNPTESFVKEIEYKDLKENLIKLLIKCKLTDKEIQIIKYRFGFGCESMSLKQIHEILGITTERVRQLEMSGINKIRRSKYIKDFAVYMDKEERCIKNVLELNNVYIGHKNFTSYTCDEDGNIVRKNKGKTKKLEV